MAISIIKATSKCHVRNSNDISVSVSANSNGTATYTFSEAVPQGVHASREFVRTDSGGYNIIIDAPMYSNYIVYQSLGSAPTLRGYVRDLYVE